MRTLLEVMTDFENISNELLTLKNSVMSATTQDEINVLRMNWEKYNIQMQCLHAESDCIRRVLSEQQEQEVSEPPFSEEVVNTITEVTDTMAIET